MLASKNAQNHATKNITSEAINNAIPYLSPITTIGLWCPSCSASLITSLHHPNIVAITKKPPNPNTHVPKLILCINIIAPTAITKPDIAPAKGQGLGSTK